MTVIQNPPAVPSPSTTNAVIGKFHNGGKYDIFQIVDSSGGDVLHMNYDGSLEPSIYPLIFKTKILTSELLSLSTVPVEIIPAAGPGTILVPQYFSLQLDVAGPAFSISNAGAGNTYIYWKGLGSGTAGDTAVAIVPDTSSAQGMGYVASVSQFISFPSYVLSSVPVAPITNQPMLISMDDVLSGGAGNSMLITISYVVVTI